MWLFNFFSKQKNKNRKNSNQPEEENLNEYTFIWYKKMASGNKTFYTQPFRTTIKAKSEEEAKDKVIDFVKRKMELIVVKEEDFTGSLVGNQIFSIQKMFTEINKSMSQLDSYFHSFNKL